MSKMARNAIKCRYCDKVLESRDRHDYRTHSCPKAPIAAWEHDRNWVDDLNAPGGMRLVELSTMHPPMIMVDGGLDYARRAGMGHYIELSEYEPE